MSHYARNVINIYRNHRRFPQSERTLVATQLLGLVQPAVRAVMDSVLSLECSVYVDKLEMHEIEHKIVQIS